MLVYTSSLTFHYQLTFLPHLLLTDLIYLLFHKPQFLTNTVKSNPCFRYEGKTGGERNLVILKIPQRITISSFRRDLFIDIVFDRFIFKITKLRSAPVSPSYLKQVWNYLKQGVDFTYFFTNLTQLTSLSFCILAETRKNSSSQLFSGFFTVPDYLS